MNYSKFKHSDITGQIIKCAMTVHSRLGSGFQELIYQRALSMEFELNRLAYEREKEMEVYYRGKPIGNRRVDFFVCDVIMVEIKAVSKLLEVHLAQAINYLEAYNKEVGLLINFGSKSLEFKRTYNSRYINPYPAILPTINGHHF